MDAPQRHDHGCRENPPTSVALACNFSAPRSSDPRSGLPALDTQFGGMLHGRTGSGDRVYWSLGLYNGNSSANANVRLQSNVIGTHFNGPSSQQGFDHERTQPSWLTQLQFKF